MMINQYNLCVRGNGNFSHRFYETLASGRIPVYVNTGGKLPWDHIINYRPYFVWVDDIKCMVEDVRRFHATHDIREAQKRCRELYDLTCSYSGWVNMFHQHHSTLG